MPGLPWNRNTWAHLAQQRFGIQPGHTTSTPPAWVPPASAPPGTYDPSLDFQGEQTGLGFGYSQEDLTRDLGRAGTDYQTALGQARTGHTSRLGALGTALERANTDYGTNTRELGTQYQRLRSSQSQRANAAGVSLGGAGLQSAQKRAANQSVDQSKLDQAIERYRADNTTAVGDENQSWRDLVGTDEHGGSLGTALNRRVEDLNTGGTRAFESNSLFLDQLNRAKTYSAQEAGLLPTRPFGTVAGLAPGAQSGVFGGVEYGQGPGAFLQPVGRPSAQSVLATGSLLGTDITRRRRPRGY